MVLHLRPIKRIHHLDESYRSNQPDPWHRNKDTEQITFLLFLKMAEEQTKAPYNRKPIVPAKMGWASLLAAHDYVSKHFGNKLDTEQKKHLRQNFVRGWELVPATARLCIMNLYLHGINADPCPVHSGLDSLAGDPGERFSLVLTNPPFGKKSSIAIVNEEGDLEKEDTAYEGQDFWTATKNKQLNFLQHIKTLLKMNGRCAVVVPDNVLFEGGAGETVRRNLLKGFDVHTLLRLPTGIFYAQGVKANVLFFDAKPAQEPAWTSRRWVYDLRTNRHFTLKTNSLKRADLDDFVACYNPDNRHERKATWSEKNSEGRWSSFRRSLPN